MNISTTPLPGVLVIEPRIFRDDRGLFLEAFNAERFTKHGLPGVFRQANHSRSMKGVLRGLHYQVHRPQGKLITTIRGTIFDVAVDVRRGSDTFGQWHGMTLSGEAPQYLWIPPGFAHGFCVLSQEADVVYQCTELYVQDEERGLAWNDSDLAIEWPIDNPILSEKDRNLATLREGDVDLPVFAGGG